jgi:uncharacterized YigZ family protein
MTMFTDTYYTIKQKCEGEFKEKGSHFIGYAFPVETEAEVKEIIQAIKKEHYAAAHHCSAFVLGNAQQIQKSNDDREPNNTAGKPILRVILSKGLTNVLVVVVRYFGGKLLGVPGLISAYGQGATEALTHATIEEKIIKERYEVEGNYEDENELYKVYKTFGIKIVSHTYNDNQFKSIFDIRKSNADQAVKAIKDKRLFTITFLEEK